MARAHRSGARWGSDWKGKLSPLVYIVAIVGAFFWMPMISELCYVVAALIWLVPAPRIEKMLASEPS